jgi:hypothetical protein
LNEWSEFVSVNGSLTAKRRGVFATPRRLDIRGNDCPNLLRGDDDGLAFGRH